MNDEERTRLGLPQPVRIERGEIEDVEIHELSDGHTIGLGVTSGSLYAIARTA